MTTLTPSQYEVLPEAVEAYWQEDWNWMGEHWYTPVMIPLAEAERIIKEAFISSKTNALTEALTKLKNLKR